MDTNPPQLLPEHLEDLRKSGLSARIIDAMGVYSLRPEEFEEKVGKKLAGVDSYLAIPYPGQNGFQRFKLFPALVEPDGKTQKYYQLPSTGNHLYALPVASKFIKDLSCPLFVVEGEKKTALLTQSGKACIGLGGIWNWINGDTHQPILDFDWIAWKGRITYLVPDSDFVVNDSIALAVYKLGRELERREAVVRILKIPVLQGLEKTGIDDYLTSKTLPGKAPKQLQSLCDRAITLAYSRFNSFRQQEKQTTRQKTQQEAKDAEEKRRAEQEARSKELLSFPSDLYKIHAKLEETSSATHDLIELILATAVSLQISKKYGDALLWLLVVGPPSSDKTSQVGLLRDMPNIYFLDILTENAFITGYIPESGGAPKDLLSELDQRCLVMKELGVLFSLKSELIHKVLGDLQAIYDGQFSKYTGTRGMVEYKAVFPLIGCVTPLALNQHQRYMALIGPRFLFYSMPALSDSQLKTGFELSWQGEIRAKDCAELKKLVSAYGWQRYCATPEVANETPEQQERLNNLAKFLCCGRAVVLTERHQEQSEEGKTFTTYESVGFQKEEPWRALQQLRVLGRSLAHIHKRTCLTEHEFELLRRVVLSSMPPDRLQALALFQGNTSGGLTRKEAAASLRHSYNQAKRLLQELERLGLLWSEKVTQDTAEGDTKDHTEWLYHPSPEFADLITKPLEPLDHLLDLDGIDTNFPQGHISAPLHPKTEASSPEKPIATVRGMGEGEVYGNSEDLCGEIPF